MKLLTVLLLISFQLCFSQNIDSIKNADTIYIHYKGRKGESKNIYITNKITGPRTTYEFIINTKFDLSIRTSKYLNFDDYEIGKLADRRIEDCRFLKTHKDVIITSKFLRNLLKDNSKDEIYNWIKENIKNKKKTFYLIDKDKNKNGKVFLFEANPFIESYEPPSCIVEPLEIRIINTDSINKKKQ